MEAPEIIAIRDRENHPDVVGIAEPIAKEKLAKGSKLRLPLPIGAIARLQSISELIEKCGETASDHGFWEAHLDTALKTCNIPRNVYDAVIAESNGVKITKAQEDLILSSGPLSLQCLAIRRLQEAELLGDPTIFLALIMTECAEAIEAARTSNWCAPSGVWEELSDVVIRLFDFIARYGPRHSMTPALFLATVQAKMAVNEARPPKHGKNF